MGLFSKITEAPPDPILGVTTAFEAEKRSNKVNLGVGVYRDADLKVPLLASVHEAEVELAKARVSRSYLPIDGNHRFVELIGDLAFGDSKSHLKGISGAQTPGGSAALRVAGDFLAIQAGVKEIYLSDPTWGNHHAIFAACGIKLKSYPYYNAKECVLDFDRMIETLKSLPQGSLVLLHASCHNPTGVDPSPEQWKEIVRVLEQQRLLPLFDMAYQGFGDGIKGDALPIHLFAKTGLDMLVTFSCSKNFGLYSERVGALFVVSQSPTEAKTISSQLCATIRMNYSNPPFHGAKVVELILSSPERTTAWLQELDGMRRRIHSMRTGLVKALSERMDRDFTFLGQQRGLFSFIGLAKPQVERLLQEFAIYTPPNGRINVCGLNEKNLHYVADALSAVMAR